MTREERCTLEEPRRAGGGRRTESIAVTDNRESRNNKTDFKTLYLTLTITQTLHSVA